MADGNPTEQAGALVRTLAHERIDYIKPTDKMRAAHALYEKLQKMRGGGTKAVALYYNFRLRPPTGVSLAVGGGIFLGGVIIGFPILGLLIGGGAIVYRNFSETGKLRRRGGTHRYRRPEHDNAWLQMTHQFVRMAAGFNARLRTVKTLQHDKRKLDAVSSMNALLIEARPALARAREILGGFEAFATGRLFEGAVEVNERLRELDPLDAGLGTQGLVWLETEAHRESVPITEFEACLLRDISFQEGYKEL